MLRGDAFSFCIEQSRKRTLLRFPLHHSKVFLVTFGGAGGTITTLMCRLGIVGISVHGLEIA
jgi:hypothetical protein